MMDTEVQTQSRFIEKLLERAKSLAAEEESEMLTYQRPNWRNSHSQGKPQPNRQPASSLQRDQQYRQAGGSSGSTDKRVCHYCKKVGHIKSECRKLARRQQADQVDIRNQQCNRAEIMYMAVGTCKVSSSGFIADSGCTSHMSPRREWFVNYHEFLEPGKIRIGDDSELVAIGSGEIKTSAGCMTNVYLVPELCTNLLSISAACDQMPSGLDFWLSWRAVADYYNEDSSYYEVFRQRNCNKKMHGIMDSDAAIAKHPLDIIKV